MKYEEFKIERARKMKIGYFIGKFSYQNPVQNYGYGGGGVVAYNLAINMAKRGMRFIFLQRLQIVKNQLTTMKG